MGPSRFNQMANKTNPVLEKVRTQSPSLRQFSFRLVFPRSWHPTGCAWRWCGAQCVVKCRNDELHRLWLRRSSRVRVLPEMRPAPAGALLGLRQPLPARLRVLPQMRPEARRSALACRGARTVAIRLAEADARGASSDACSLTCCRGRSAHGDRLVRRPERLHIALRAA